MIETPHSLHTHSRSTLYIYKVLQLFQLWPVVIRVHFQPDMCSLKRWGSGSRQFTWFLTCIMCKVMIETSHPIHTHSRSTLYIYKVFQHLLLWLVVIWMQAYTMWQWHSVSLGQYKIHLGSHLYHAACYDVVTPFTSFS